MTATQNSIEAYADLLESGELGASQKIVFDFIRRNPNSSYNDIARALHLHHNAVTARIKELRDGGYIVCGGAKIDAITKKPNNTYRVRKAGEDPDVTSNDVRPVMPQPIADFLRRAVHGEIITDELTVMDRGVQYKVTKTEVDGITFEYGDFLKMDRVLIVCENNAQDVITLWSIGVTAKFRLN